MMIYINTILQLSLKQISSSVQGISLCRSVRHLIGDYYMLKFEGCIVYHCRAEKLQFEV